MSNKNYFELKLSSDAFNALKSDFDSMLRQVLYSMEQKEAEEGSMTIKLDISLLKEHVTDYKSSIEGAQREIIVPKFKHKVTSTITYKDEKSGFLGGRFELVWDPATSGWILREIDDGQTTLFDDEEENAKPAATNGDSQEAGSEPAALPPHQDALPPRKEALPAAAEETIEADYTVVDESGTGDGYGYEEPARGGGIE